MSESRTHRGAGSGRQPAGSARRQPAGTNPAPRRGTRPLPRGTVGARDHQRPSAVIYRRRRLVVLGGLVAVVAVVVAAFVWPGFARSTEPATAASPTATTTVTAAAPSPRVSPIARTDTSAFAQALPATVLDFALVAEQPDKAFVEAGALESYAFTYADGTAPDAAKVTVVAGQWPTADEAKAAATQALSSVGAPTETGDVVDVDGNTNGTYVIVEPGDGTATVVWSNVTAVLKATGPADAVRSLYRAFTL